MIPETERQALITLLEAAEQTPPAGPDGLDALADRYFCRQIVDWRAALPALAARGLIREEGGATILSAEGEALARSEREARPAMWYWYTDYYAALPHSPATAAFCARVYGRDLGQHGYVAMAQLEALLTAAMLGPDSRALDLGCGDGRIAEYISDTTGAHVHGLDYIPAAIDSALERTASKRARLTFSVGDMNDLDFPPGSFDAVIAADTLYFGDMAAAIGRLKTILTPGGQLLAYYGLILWHEDDDRAPLHPDRTPLAEALRAHDMAHTTQDFTQAEYARSLLSLETCREMQAAFEAEGNAFIWENRRIEAEGNLHFIESGRLTRYLYHARV